MVPVHTASRSVRTAGGPRPGAQRSAAVVAGWTVVRAPEVAVAGAGGAVAVAPGEPMGPVAGVSPVRSG